MFIGLLVELRSGWFGERALRQQGPFWFAALVSSALASLPLGLGQKVGTEE